MFGYILFIGSMCYNFLNIEYIGFYFIKYELGVYIFVISFVFRYYGKLGWIEFCELLLVIIGKNNELFCFDKFIVSGSFQGKFDYYGGDNLFWMFSFKFNIKIVFIKVEYLVVVIEGKYKISKEVRLQFYIDIFKQIFECDLCKFWYFVYEEFYYVDIEFEYLILIYIYVQRLVMVVQGFVCV